MGLDEIISNIMLYVFMSVPLVAFLGVLYESSDMPDKRRKKKLKKLMNKKGFDSLSEWAESVVETRHDEWVKEVGALVHYFDRDNEKEYICYRKYPNGFREMLLSINGDVLLEIELDGAGCTVKNEVDDSLDEKMDALKCQRILEHLDVFFEDAFGEEIETGKHLEQKALTMKKEEKDEWTRHLLAFLEQLSKEGCTKEGTANSDFRLVFHQDRFGSYVTLCYGDTPVYQGNKDVENSTFISLSKKAMHREAVKENELYLQEKLLEMMLHYEMNTNEIISRAVSLLDRLEKQKEWLEKDELIWLHEAKKDMYENIEKGQRINWPLYHIHLQGKEMEKMENQVEKRKLWALRQQAQVIKMRAD